MSTQKALFLTEKHGPFVVQETTIPQPGPGKVLIKVQAAALNPADWIIQAMGLLIDKYPAILGFDVAGTIEAVGEGVDTFKQGDRVVTGAPAGHYEHAGFQQYALGNADVTAKLPPNISFDQAATVPLGLATAAIGFFNHNGLGLSPPWEEGGRYKYRNKPILVLGGSTSVGQFGIQLVKLSGFNPIMTTASPRNAAWLKVLGATHVIDRNLSPAEIKAEVLKITSEPMEVAYDIVSSEDSETLAYELLAPGGGLLITGLNKIENIQVPEKRIVRVFGNVTAPVSRALGASLYSKLTELLETGDIKPNRFEVLPGGLGGIVGGLERLKKGEVSGIKLVVHPQETI